MSSRYSVVVKIDCLKNVDWWRTILGLENSINLFVFCYFSMIIKKVMPYLFIKSIVTRRYIICRSLSIRLISSSVEQDGPFDSFSFSQTRKPKHYSVFCQGFEPICPCLGSILSYIQYFALLEFILPMQSIFIAIFFYEQGQSPSVV